MNAIVEVEHSVPEAAMREKVMRLQVAGANLPQVSLPTLSYFANGMYARECHISKGTVFVGQMHTQEHFFFLLKGSASLTTAEGIKLVAAPFFIVSEPGTKRAGYCHEDCIFLAIHRTDNTDIAEIRKEVTGCDPLDLYDEFNVVRAPALEQH